MSKILLEVEDLDVSYGPIPAVRNASLHVSEGEIVVSATAATPISNSGGINAPPSMRAWLTIKRLCP